MAPSGRTTTTTTTTSTRTRRRTTSKTKPRTTTTTTTRQKRKTTHFKKRKQNHNTKSKKQVLPSSCSSISSQDSSKEVQMESSEVIHVSNSPCSTPKGQKFRIPEISTCPPAPKKPRVLSNCSLRRSPLSFFAPPDLELFFFMALRDVSV